MINPTMQRPLFSAQQRPKAISQVRSAIALLDPVAKDLSFFQAHLIEQTTRLLIFTSSVIEINMCN